MHHVLRSRGCCQCRMGRDDVAAHMIIHLVDSVQVAVVCRWLETLDRHECLETLLHVCHAIARLKRSDVDAAVGDSIKHLSLGHSPAQCPSDVVLPKYSINLCVSKSLTKGAPFEMGVLVQVLS